MEAVREKKTENDFCKFGWRACGTRHADEVGAGLSKCEARRSNFKLRGPFKTKPIRITYY